MLLEGNCVAKRLANSQVTASNTSVESALRNLLYRGAEGTQIEIAKQLSELGVQATQSSISRALKRLRAVKVRSERGKVIWHLQQNPASTRLTGAAGELVVTVIANAHLIVVHTEPGAAARVAYYLDRVQPGGIIGTIAGDDTVFVAPPSGVKIERVLKEVRLSLRK